MRVVHLAERIIPFWPESAGARASAELPLAQVHSDDEVIVVGAAPVSKVEAFTSTQQFARRLEPLSVSAPGGAFEAIVLESTLGGTSIRLYLLVVPEGHGVTGFGLAARALLGSLPDAPDLIHLHGDTGLDLDAAREELDGVAVIQSVYENEGSEGLAAALQDADEVVTPCADFVTAPEGNGSAVTRALQEHSGLRVVAQGIDLRRWDPSHDNALPVAFDTEALEGKAACKEALQKKAGLTPRADVPIIVVWSTGGSDGGLGIVAEQLEEILALDVQLVVLCEDGKDAALEAFTNKQVWQADAGDARLLRLVLAGSDVALLPDLKAPLGQRALVATRYALVPVARWVNAHRDRLVEYDGLSNTGGAFLFGDPVDVELLTALRRMRRIYGAEEIWPGMVRANGAVDMGWSRTADQLQTLYAKALSK